MSRACVSRHRRGGRGTRSTRQPEAVERAPTGQAAVPGWSWEDFSKVGANVAGSSILRAIWTIRSRLAASARRSMNGGASRRVICGSSGGAGCRASVLLVTTAKLLAPVGKERGDTARTAATIRHHAFDRFPPVAALTAPRSRCRGRRGCRPTLPSHRVAGAGQTRASGSSSGSRRNGQRKSKRSRRSWLDSLWQDRRQEPGRFPPRIIAGPCVNVGLNDLGELRGKVRPGKSLP